MKPLWRRAQEVYRQARYGLDLDETIRVCDMRLVLAKKPCDGVGVDGWCSPSREAELRRRFVLAKFAPMEADVEEEVEIEEYDQYEAALRRFNAARRR